MLWEGLPFIFLGTLVSGLIDAYLPQRLLERVLPRSRTGSVFAGGLLGIVFPVCECAIVPVIRRLLHKGLPLSCGLTYMLASPVVNPLVIASTALAFKNNPLPMTFARVGLGYLVAVTIGLLIIRLRPRDILNQRVAAAVTKNNDRSESPHEHKHYDPDNGHENKRDNHDHDHHHQVHDVRLVQAGRTAMRDFVDTTMYFVIGCCITAFFNTEIDKSVVSSVAGNEYTAIGVLMLFAFVSSLCSTSDAFIAATLNGFSMASKLAFLVFGPMMDLKLLFMYQTVFKRGFILKLFVGLFLLVGILALLAGAFLPGFALLKP